MDVEGKILRERSGRIDRTISLGIVLGETTFRTQV